MATAQENLARFQEISNRGLMDQLDPERRARFDEAVKRGLVTVQPEGNVLTRVLEPAATIASSLVAEPLSGLAGIAAGVIPGGETAAEAVESTREALTFQPRTKAGEAGLQAVAGAVEPIGEALSTAETFLGDTVFDVTGSPFLASAATTLPTAAIEALGFGAGRRAAQLRTGLKGAPSKLPSPTKIKDTAVSKAIVEAAPDVQQIKDVSRGIYKEIDDLGVTIRPRAYKSFIDKVVKRAKKERLNPRRTPESAGAVEEFVKELDSLEGKTITDMDDLRLVAQDAANSLTPADSRVGVIMLDEIDSFLDTIPESAFKGEGAANAENIGQRFRSARNLWGRARRAELISEAMQKADRQASGFENGMRTQLRQIVNNKKRARFFTKDEIAAMDEVIKGSGEQNILKLVGRFGFSEGQATNVLGGVSGFFLGGPALPVVGQISRKLAQRATKKGIDIADAVIKSGGDGRKIAEAYLQVTPKSQRTVAELTDLLVDPNVDLTALLDSADKLTREAAEIARGRRAFNVSEAVGTALPAATVEEQ